MFFTLLMNHLRYLGPNLLGQHWFWTPNLLRALRDLLFLAWPKFLCAARPENQGLVAVEGLNQRKSLPGMHALFPRANRLTDQIINAAIEVHRHFGPGLLESIYEWALVRELELRQLAVTNQRRVVLSYKGRVREDVLRCDVLVESAVLVELKAVEEVLPIHKAQLLSYMQLLELPLGLLINFNRVRLVDGISRLILRGADQPD